MTHPLVKTLMFGFILIIQQNLVLCLTKFVDTLLQPISKSQKSYLSLKNRTFLVSMDVMSLDTNIQQNEGILKLSVTKQMTISTKAAHSYTLLAGNAQINPQRKFLPLPELKALSTKPWNCNGHKDGCFDSFANIFMTYIETTTEAKLSLEQQFGNAIYTISFLYGT